MKTLDEMLDVLWETTNSSSDTNLVQRNKILAGGPGGGGGLDKSQYGSPCHLTIVVMPTRGSCLRTNFSFGNALHTIVFLFYIDQSTNVGGVDGTTPPARFSWVGIRVP